MEERTTDKRDVAADGYQDIPLEKWEQTVGVDDGVLPNGRVEDVSADEWNAALTLMTERGWRAQHGAPYGRQVADLLADDTVATVKCCLPSGVQINVFPRTLDQIDFDLDLRDITDQRRLNDLTVFIRALGDSLARVVLLSLEGADNLIFCHYDSPRQAFWIGAPSDRSPIPDRSRCPACGWPGLRGRPYERWPDDGIGDAKPPYSQHFGGASFEICACCGFEFGFDDDAGASGSDTSFDEYRSRWRRAGANWLIARERPRHWSLDTQLRQAGLDG